MVVLMSDDLQPILSDIKSELATLNANLANMAECVKDHETRLRTSEVWRNRLIGALGIVGTLFGYVSQHIWRHGP